MARPFIEAVHRFDPGLEIAAINTKGSTENVPMLEAGTLSTSPWCRARWCTSR